MSIRHFSDHAANERTFLAWVRTSIAIIAFGFLIERFDLFLDFPANQAGNNQAVFHHSELGAVAGLILIVAGVLMVVLAALRFIRTAREIDCEQVVGGTGSRLDIALAALLSVLGVTLFFYLYHAIASHS